MNAKLITIASSLMSGTNGDVVETKETSIVAKETRGLKTSRNRYINRVWKCKIKVKYMVLLSFEI